jgi:DNA-binding ferritin-like protein
MTDSGKFIKNFRAIELLYMEAKGLDNENKLTKEKKFELYKKSEALYEEAKTIANSLEERIRNLKITDENISKIKNIDHLQNIAENCYSIEDCIDVLSQLENIHKQMNNIEIVDNVQEDILYADKDKL